MANVSFYALRNRDDFGVWCCGNSITWVGKHTIPYVDRCESMNLLKGGVVGGKKVTKTILLI